MTPMSSFTFTLANGQKATFYAPTRSQAFELALTWSRARGLVDPPRDETSVLAPDKTREEWADHEKDRLAWNLPGPPKNEEQQITLSVAPRDA